MYENYINIPWHIDAFSWPYEYKRIIIEKSDGLSIRRLSNSILGMEGLVPVGKEEFKENIERAEESWKESDSNG